MTKPDGENTEASDNRLDSETVESQKINRKFECQKNWSTKYRRQTAAPNKMRDRKNEMGSSKDGRGLKRK